MKSSIILIKLKNYPILVSHCRRMLPHPCNPASVDRLHRCPPRGSARPVIGWIVRRLENHGSDNLQVAYPAPLSIGSVRDSREIEQELTGREVQGIRT